MCAAGISTAAPAVARLLAVISRLPSGSVVFPGLASEMPAAEWDALGPHEPDPESGFTQRPLETHPQFQLKLLLDAIGAGRGEVDDWPGVEGGRPPAARDRDRQCVRTAGVHRKMAGAEAA